VERLIFIVVGIALVVLFALLAPVVSKWCGGAPSAGVTRPRALQPQGWRGALEI